MIEIKYVGEEIVRIGNGLNFFRDGKARNAAEFYLGAKVEYLLVHGKTVDEARRLILRQCEGKLVFQRQQLTGNLTPISEVFQDFQNFSTCLVAKGISATRIAEMFYRVANNTKED